MVKIAQKYSIYPPKQITSEIFLLKTIISRLATAKKHGYDPCPEQKDDILSKLILEVAVMFLWM